METFQPREVLIVDDDADNNLFCRMAVKSVVKTDIRDFTDPDEALRYLKENTPEGPKDSVLFLDLNMPSMTGWDFLEYCSRLDSFIDRRYRIFILSSSVDEKDSEKAKAHGMVEDYLEKPLTKPKLKKILGLKD